MTYLLKIKMDAVQQVKKNGCYFGLPKFFTPNGDDLMILEIKRSLVFNSKATSYFLIGTELLNQLNPAGPGWMDFNNRPLPSDDYW
jgi:gliding motility-associated-like protein